MRTKRIRWLLGIIIVEFLVITGLVIWTIVKDDEPPASDSSVVENGGELAASLLADGLDAPTNIVATPLANDNRLFITEQAGRIVTIDKNGGQGTTFLDLTSKVKSGGEMGLLGLVFHPDFAQNGYFFVNYTDKSDNTIIARYQVNAEGVGDPASEKILLTQRQPFANHNGGALAFGADGFLYAALGDGGGAGDPGNRAQNKGELLGKILRLDINNGDPYSVPASNPFVQEAGAKPEIWALGLRNPWRISFDRSTGDLWIADVGQGEYEEINFQPASSKGGENYGWRCFEGDQQFESEGCQSADSYVKPLITYSHANGRCSVTGGYVYRGTRSPALVGKYIYGDYCSGELFVAERQENTAQVVATLDTSYSISSFGEDASGELYFADIAGGNIYKIETH